MEYINFGEFRRAAIVCPTGIKYAAKAAGKVEVSNKILDDISGGKITYNISEYEDPIEVYSEIKKRSLRQMMRHLFALNKEVKFFTRFIQEEDYEAVYDELFQYLTGVAV